MIIELSFLNYNCGRFFKIAFAVENGRVGIGKRVRNEKNLKHMLGDLDNESKYLESIDNGEENLEIKLENLKKNDWKRMNSLGENDNRLGLVHMGFECSLHDIYDPSFSSEGNSEQKEKSEWREEELWESEDEKQEEGQFEKRKRGKSVKRKRRKVSAKRKRRWRFSVGDKRAYEEVKEGKMGKDSAVEELYRQVKGQFSDFYDIEFIDQVWQMREMRGRPKRRYFPRRTPSPKRKNGDLNKSSNSKFNVSRTYSQTDSLTIKLSCIGNPKSEMVSECNESLMGILDDFGDLAKRPLGLRGETADLTSQRKSYPGIGSSKNPSNLSSKKNIELKFSEKKQHAPKRFRKRKGISGTNSLSEMTGMFEDDLSNFMSNLDKEGPFKEQNERGELLHLTTQTSKNWDPEQKIFNTMNGMTVVTKSEDEKDGRFVKNKSSVPEEVKIENISNQILEIANKKFMEEEKGNERLSHREVAVSTERGLNFLIENWKELGTLKNPPNTLEQFSARKDVKAETAEIPLERVKIEELLEEKPATVRELNPEHLLPNCFLKKATQEKDSLLEEKKLDSLQKSSSNESSRKEEEKEEDKKSESSKSTPQNGKKVQVPLLKQPFSNFYLPNAKKIFAKSSANFSKTQKQLSGANMMTGTQKTISDNFLFENNPPKSHRQFSNKKRLRNDALKKKLKMNSKKKNSKELQKILEFKKNLVAGKKVESKLEDSLRRLKTKKPDSKCFQSDRNLSTQKSRK